MPSMGQRIDADWIEMQEQLPNASGSVRRTRGRPRSFDRDKVLCRATKVFWTRGYDAASIEELTEALGIKRSSLYHEFGGKEALFLASVDYYLSVKVAPCLERLEKGRELSVDLSDFFDGLLGLTCRPEGPRGCLVTVVLADAAESSSRFKEKLIECIARLDDSFVRRFEKARLSGDLPQDEDVNALAQLFVSFSHGLMVRARSGVSLKPLKEISEAALRRLLPASPSIAI